MRPLQINAATFVLCLMLVATNAAAGLSRLGSAKRATAGENWLQLKYDSMHSGNVPDRTITVPLGLVGAVPLTDAIFTAPVVTDGHVYVVDGAGVAFCIDAASLQVVWKHQTRRTKANCNNVSSPAIIGQYLHFGTMAGSYYVLDAATGKLVKEIRCGEPIFSTPVAANARVYFATLGSQVYALEPDGTVCWTWDYVKERLNFTGNRWSSQEWCKHKGGRVTWRDRFCCSRNLACYNKLIVAPAGAGTVCLEDIGARAELRAVSQIPSYVGSENPAVFGMSIAEDGAIYQQWHRRDNAGRVEIVRLRGDKIETDFVPGTQTAINLPRLLSFSSVSVRGQDVYRCSPEDGFGLCRHSLDQDRPLCLSTHPSITPPILLREHAIYGGLDGSLYIVPLSGSRKIWSFKTAFGKAVTAPVAVCDGKIYFGCEDGYLYILGPRGKATPPTKDLQLWKIRSPLTSKFGDSKYDWFTNFGNPANTNTNNQGLRPPFKIKWIRRYEGTFKHTPVCGGGRMYTHTAEGQIFALEQETGRLLWRRYWPGVHLSFTSPVYHDERLIVPQAGIKKSLLRCLDAGTGELLWEAPFTGSPSWSRQAPPVVYNNLAIYVFGSGKYTAQGTEKAYIFRGTPKPSPDGAEIMSWIYTHDNPYYPKDNRPLVRAWDLETGEVVWSKDFSEFGSGGNDSGLCLMDDTLYYSSFFGYAARTKEGRPKANGLTAAIEPTTGRVIWLTTEHYVTAGCTISAKNDRLYLGGYNRPNEETKTRHVWCLDARNGSLIWQSEPIAKAVNVVTIGERFVFVHGSTGRPSYLIDKDTGKILSNFDKKYACTRFTLSEPYILGCNMDMIDTTRDNKVVSSGPAVDARECIAAIVSNGRVFYTSQSSGMQVSQVYGAEAAGAGLPWR